MRSSNPVFRDDIYNQSYPITEKPMTIGGTLNKLLILSLVMMLGAYAVYYQFYLSHYDFVMLTIKFAPIVGLILGLIICFKPKTSGYLSPLYALSQGAVISGLSCYLNQLYDGIVIQAASITLIVLFMMALLYSLRIIKATEKFKSIIILATASIFVFYLISYILMLFHVNVPYFTSNSSISIAVNIGIAIIAGLNLILDFDRIENGAMKSLPSFYEWYCAFGLLVTIVWLYIEILRILAKMKRR